VRNLERLGSAILPCLLIETPNSVKLFHVGVLRGGGDVQPGREAAQKS
jgi:hypothetical protein